MNFLTFSQPEPEPERKSSLSDKKSSSPNHNTDGETSNLVSDVPGGYIHTYKGCCKKNYYFVFFCNILYFWFYLTKHFSSVDTNLIQLDTDDLATNTNTYADNDDDIIFEVIFFCN